MNHLIFDSMGTIHSFGVERHGNITVGINGNQTSVATNGFQFLIDNNIGSLKKSESFVFHEAGNIISNYGANEKFTMAGTGNCASFVVSIGACANNRRVANAAEHFISYAPG